jgi:hypothetical protein
MMFIASKQTDYTKLRQLEKYLPFLITQSSPQELLVVPDITAQGLAHPVMKLTGADTDSSLWNRLPPMYRTETFVRSKPEATVLSTIRVNNAALPEPLILSAKFQRRRTLAVLGYGLYRWKLLDYALEKSKGREATDIFTMFIKQSVQWLTTERQGKQVRIRTNETFYADGETVEILGQVYDESFNPLEDARVNVSLGSVNDSVKRDVDLINIGGGRYRATVEGLPTGEYSFSGRAVYKNSTVGKDEGRFSIGELNIEFQNPRMNAQLLRLIAERTGGKFYTPGSMESLFRDIEAQSGFTPRQIQNKENYLLWTIIWILSTVVLLFALEWFLRKKSGLV